MKKNLQTAFSTRQYMLSKDFEIYYYNDIEHPKVEAHSHSYYEFYFFLEGEINLYINEVPIAVRPGDFLLIPPGLSHCPSFLSPDTPYRRFVLWISPEYCEGLTQASTDYIYLMQLAATNRQYHYTADSITFNAIQSMIFQLIEETKSHRFGREAKVSLDINSLLLFLNRYVYEQNHSSTAESSQALYLNLCGYIAAHLDEELTLERLSHEFFVSRFHISHAFKDNMGISIHQYILKKRLAACRDAILCGEPITRVFEQFGFHDYSSFYRAFKKEYGLSPKELKEINVQN